MDVGSRSDARDEAMSPRVIKCFEMPAVGSQSNASDAFLRDLISTVITLAINGEDYIASGEPDLATYPSSLK